MSTVVGTPPGVTASGFKAVLPFLPTELPGLVAWFDAADPTTITHTAGVVSQWNDKSGGALTAKPVTGSGPTTGARTIGGKNALYFNSAVHLEVSSFPPGGHPSTVFTVVQSDATTATNAQILGYSGGSLCVMLNSSQWALYSGGYLNAPTVLNTTPHVVTGIFNTTASGIRMDGATVVSGSLPAVSWASLVPIGSQMPPAAYWFGLIAEIIVYNRLLTTPEIQQVEQASKKKWGTP